MKQNYETTALYCFSWLSISSKARSEVISEIMKGEFFLVPQKDNLALEDPQVPHPSPDLVLHASSL